MVRREAAQLRENAERNVAVRAHRRDGGAAETGAECARAGRRGRELRKTCPYSAVVGDGLTCAGSGGDGESLDRTDPDRDVDAVEVLRPVSVGGRIGDEVVDHARLLRHDIVQARDNVAAAIRQSRVDWRHDAEWRQIGRLQRAVVHERKPVVPAAGVSDGDRRSRADLLLDRDAKMPIGRPDAPAFEQSRIEIVREHVPAEARVRDDAAQIASRGAKILCRAVHQIAVGYEILIGVGPGACHPGGAERRRRLRHAQRGIGVGVRAGHAGALEVLAEGHLQRSLAGPGHVVGRAHPQRHVLVAVDSACFGDDDRRRKEPRRSFLLRWGTSSTPDRIARLPAASADRASIDPGRYRPCQATRALLTHGEIDCVNWFGTPLLNRYVRFWSLVIHVRSSVMKVC